MNIELAPNFQIDKCHIEFVATLSDYMRKAMEFAPQTSKDHLSDLIKNVVVDIVDNHPDVAASLRAQAVDGYRTMRQCDIRRDDGHGNPAGIAFKTFFMWNRDLKIWHIFVEMPNEYWIEQDVVDPAIN